VIADTAPNRFDELVKRDMRCTVSFVWSAAVLPPLSRLVKRYKALGYIETFW